MATQIKKDDVGCLLSFTITDQSGSALNLTGATVTLTIAGGDISTKHERACTIDSAVNGTCHYILIAADTAVAGKYSIEANIAYSGSNFTTVTKGELEVLDTL